MKKQIKSFFILISFFMLGVFLISNLSVIKSVVASNLNKTEYEDSSKDKISLYEDINFLKSENEKIKEKIKMYKKSNNKEIIVNDMKKQLDIYKSILGFEKVQGSGLVIKITDGYYDFDTSTIEKNKRILHDIDVALILNEIKFCGAEAIAINDYRILGNTGVECDWAFIGFNDYKYSIEYPPFYFYIIGDPDKLESQLFSESSHITKLIRRNLNIEIEKRNNITLKATNMNLEANFMEKSY